ncbi:MAG: hypothetical protein NPIRA02_32690 [Nitrospirales bacterium]|nr:MAG: hypothetical protein NPIRA02_32690 [Nitrospirales bacterium]
MREKANLYGRVFRAFIRDRGVSQGKIHNGSPPELRGQAVETLYRIQYVLTEVDQLTLAITHFKHTKVIGNGYTFPSCATNQ